uniref:C2 domain-containing protein n=1 Tax=Chromera velia CCMP2878 TaxID=1169474 RepID=A0A0G4I519_9ALVE|eukprot:Cvel_11063.t1-p1 / transcript=Cvel_11063.t1 / gene=Cvel_11063 / organism=Chromera_velia_CCMP2878 / gene_product=hypothetical protein / transcript_product=hypothetical protein / location=Cvel_scaffold682:69203-72581(-) / protein_length=553 / sequence_SO=supercontig / SO=protein_coding / is_pseudo=false
MFGCCVSRPKDAEEFQKAKSNSRRTQDVEVKQKTKASHKGKLYEGALDVICFLGEVSYYKTAKANKQKPKASGPHAASSSPYAETKKKTQNKEGEDLERAKSVALEEEDLKALTHNKRPFSAQDCLQRPLYAQENNRGYAKLELTVHGARSLLPMDFNLFQHGTSDPFFRISLDGKPLLKSRTISELWTQPGKRQFTWRCSILFANCRSTFLIATLLTLTMNSDMRLRPDVPERCVVTVASPASVPIGSDAGTLEISTELKVIRGEQELYALTLFPPLSPPTSWVLPPLQMKSLEKNVADAKKKLQERLTEPFLEGVLYVLLWKSIPVSSVVLVLWWTVCRYPSFLPSLACLCAATVLHLWPRSLVSLAESVESANKNKKKTPLLPRKKSSRIRFWGVDEKEKGGLETPLAGREAGGEEMGAMPWTRKEAGDRESDAALTGRASIASATTAASPVLSAESAPSFSPSCSPLSNLRGAVRDAEREREPVTAGGSPKEGERVSAWRKVTRGATYNCEEEQHPILTALNLLRSVMDTKLVKRHLRFSQVRGRGEVE